MSKNEDLRILIVDDEPDVLDTLEELLTMHRVVKAGTFEEAKRQMETQQFDLAILDIMGVNGYELLDMAVARKVTAVMFTAHALSPEDTMKSFRGGAAYYVPKDKMGEMPEIIAKIWQAKQKGQTLVPLKMYFKRGRAKVLLGICQGRQKHDKREAMKKAEAHREMARQMHRR